MFFPYGLFSQNFWEHINSPENLNIFDIAVDDQGRIYLACPYPDDERGIYRSDDNGLTWELKNNGIEVPITKRITCDKYSNLFAVCSGSIFSSSDAGENWHQVFYSLWPSMVKTGYDSIWLAGGEQDFLIARSTDFGQNWEEVLEFTGFYFYPEKIQDICFGPDGVIYACSRTYVGGSGTIYSSSDYGLTWDIFYNDGYRHFTALEFDQQGRLLVGAFDLLRYDFTTGIWKVYNLGVAPYDFLCVGENEVYMTSDMNTGGFGGDAYSNDGGETFSALNSGLADPDGEFFATDKEGRILLNQGNPYLFRSYDTIFTSTNDNAIQKGNGMVMNYPNPFHEYTEFKSLLNSPIQVTIKDIMGNVIEQTELPPGGSFIFRPANNSKGIFIATYKSEQETSSVKMVKY